MSKTKKLKQKTTGFDIVYRVVTVILAVAVFPVTYFQKIVLILLDHEAISKLMELVTKDEKAGAPGTIIEASFSDMGDMLSKLSSMLGGEGGASAILSNAHFRPLIAAIAFLAVALVITLVIIGFAAFSNKVKVILGLSGGGLLMMLGSYISFSLFASPIVSGEVSLAELFGVTNGIAATVLSLIEVTAFNLQGAFFVDCFLLLGIFIWSASVLIVNMSENKENKEKKAEN